MNSRKEQAEMKEPGEVLHRCFELYHRGELARAGELAERALRKFPDEGALWQLDGLVRRDQGDFDGARSALETASLLVPLNPDSECALAQCYAKAGQTGLARDLYRHLAQSGRSPTPLLPAIASGLGSVGDNESALEVCRELSRREPTHHEAFFGMAFYMRKLRYPVAMVMPVVTRAHELAPRSIPYRVLLASLLASIGEYQQASDLLRDIPPDSVHCRCCLRRMMTIFHLAGEHTLADACQEAG
jgi:tetratricopeptide (TPR) repeat protein